MARLLFLQNLDYEFLGPMCVSAAVKARGHQCRAALGHELRNFAPTIESFRPDIVGFSISTGSHHWAYRMALRIKTEYGIRNVFGGPHPTFFPEFGRAPSVDIVVRGEGEETMADILDRIDARQTWDDVPNVCSFKDGVFVQNDVRPLRDDLDDYPFPDRNLYNGYERRLPRHVRPMITSRGCPFHCTFCFEDSLRDLYRGKGRYVRVRRVEKVIEECVSLRRDSRVRTIYFQDDVFGIRKSWLYEFLDSYKKEVGLPFICMLRADVVASEREYAFRLADAGCRSAFFGVETGSEDLRNRVIRKDLNNEQIRKAADFLHQAGIRFRTFNMLGIPDETLEDAYQTVELNMAIQTDYPWCSLYYPYAGSKLAAYAEQRGLLPQHFDCTRIPPTYFMRSCLSLPNVERIENLQKFFQTAVLWPWTWKLIKRLIRLRPNILFKWWFGLVYFYVYLKSERRNLRETLRFALFNFRHILTVDQDHEPCD